MGFQLQKHLFFFQPKPTGSSAHTLSAPNSTRTASGSVAAVLLLVKGWEKWLVNGWISSSHVKDGSSQKNWHFMAFHPLKPKKMAFHRNLPSVNDVNGWNPSTNQTWLQNRRISRPSWHRRVAPEMGRDLPVGPLLHHLAVCKGCPHPSCLGNSDKNKSSSFLRRNLMSEAKNHDIPSISQYCQANFPTVSPVLSSCVRCSNRYSIASAASGVAMAGLARQSLPGNICPLGRFFVKGMGYPLVN